MVELLEQLEGKEAEERQETRYQRDLDYGKKGRINFLFGDFFEFFFGGTFGLCIFEFGEFNESNDSPLHLALPSIVHCTTSISSKSNILTRAAISI